jgi:TonB family protein
MRRGLSKAFRSNLVAFDTDLGVRYAAPPTFWSRVYLIWTFRNFRSLPKQVFNRHQQRLIDELIRSSTVSPAAKVDRSAVIGIVEQVRSSSSRMTQLETHGQAPADDEIVAHRTAAPIIHPSRDQQRFNEQPSSHTQEPLESEASIPQALATRRRVDKKTAAFVPLAASLVLAAVFLPSRIHIHSLRSHPNPGSATLTKPASNQVQIQNLAIAAPIVAAAQSLSEQVEKPPAQLTRGPVQSSSNPDLSRQSPAAGLLDSTAVKQGPVSFASLVTPAVAPSAEAPASPTRDSADTDINLPRLAGPPQSHMVYPTYPETEQNGKVMLTAVVGQDGAVKSITVITGKKIFATAAVKAVKQWRYLPYEMEGKRVEFQTTVGFDFRGDEVVSVSFPQL